MAKSKAAKAGAAASAARSNPYVRRALEDEELRDNVRVAFEAARDAYGRLSNGKKPMKALTDDKKLQKDLKKSAEALTDAGAALREGPKRKKRRMGLGKLLFLAIVGGAIAIAVSEDFRNKVLDLVFGAEEEFDYTSTTAPPPQPAASTPST
jgi:hypothetical protein